MSWWIATQPPPSIGWWVMEITRPSRNSVTT
jgi:hypothetical protein